MKFLIGTCILLNNYQYTIIPTHPDNRGVYLLRQEVIVHEEKRYYDQLWKISYIDKNAKKCSSKK